MISTLCLSFSLYEIPSISPSSFSQHFRSLLDEADEMDSIHDVTLQAADRTFPAHKYILSMRSEFFRKLFMSEHCSVDEELDKEVRKSEDAVGCDLLILEKVPPDMLEYALHFIYTDTCELLLHGARPRVVGSLTAQNQVRKKVLVLLTNIHSTNSQQQNSDEPAISAVYTIASVYTKYLH